MLGLVIILPRQQPLADHFLDGGIGQVRVDRHRAVAQQQGEMMHLARLARLDHKTDVRARAFLDQVMVQTAHRQQHRDGRVMLVNAPV